MKSYKFIYLFNYIFYVGVQLTPLENGVFSVFAPNSEAMTEAREIIDKLLTEEVLPSSGILLSSEI